MRLTQPRNPPFDEVCDPARHYPAGFYPAPARFVTPGFEGRLSSQLRGPLQDAAGPAALLSLAATAMGTNDIQLANALADLSVTGRNMYRAFQQTPPSRLAEIISGGTTNPAIVDRVLDRALAVAWALQGYGNRAELGWIAVSGEDDPPHRPVNVPATPYQQYDLNVSVQATANSAPLTVTTRYFVARPGHNVLFPADPVIGIRERSLPPTPFPRLNRSDRVLLYLHGHSSRAEEALDLVGPATQQGFTVISLDLPCCGYSSMHDHTAIASDASTDTLARFPLLEFLDQFVVDFVKAFPGRLEDQIVAVVGGSLGGNLGLRLAGRDLRQYPFLTNIVAWSPASAWTPYTEPTRETAPNKARALMRLDPPPAAESAHQRQDYFRQVFDDSYSVVMVRPQPQYWYRDGWPCKEASIAGARLDRQEIYNALFRRWHWRIALEQLLFSHSYQRRWELPRARMLLLAGAMDDYAWSHIYDATKDLATRMTTTPGARGLLNATGHSIHNERPQWLAQMLSQFLPPIRPELFDVIELPDNFRPPGVIPGFADTPPPPPIVEQWSEWQNLGGALTSQPATGINEDGRIEVVARGADQHIWRIRQTTPNGPFDSGWLGLHGNLDSADRFGTSLALARNDDGRLELFAQLAQVQWLAHVWQTGANQEWGGWSKGNQFGQLIGGAADGVCATERLGNELLQTSEDGLRINAARQWLLTCARLTNSSIHIRGQNVRGWWTNGVALGGGQRGFIGRPCIGHSRNGLLQILSRASDGVAYVISEISTDRWAANWTPISGATITSDISVAMGIDGQLAAFARGSTGELLWARQANPDGVWQGWQSLGNMLTPEALPVAALNGWGELQVFVRTANGEIQYRRQEVAPSMNWGPWRTIPGSSGNSDPVVAANANGMLAVFCVGTDGALRVASQSSIQLPPRLPRRRKRQDNRPELPGNILPGGGPVP